MKVSTFAHRAGMCYKTAWRWWKAVRIKGYQTETGTVISTEEMNEQPRQERIVVVYACVSANENWTNLDSQAERLCYYCTAQGWKVVKVTENPIADIIADIVSILYSFCARQPRARRKTEKIVQDLNVKAE